jgi:DNA-binding transcriptional regulator YdaS (Cro superfamily)
MDKMTPNVALRVYLAKEGTPKHEFAEKIGIGKSALSDILAGRRKPKPATALAIDGHSGGEVSFKSWWAEE